MKRTDDFKKAVRGMAVKASALPAATVLAVAAMPATALAATGTSSGTGVSALLSKWTSMITQAQTGLTGLLTACALLALGAMVLLAVFTHNDQKKFEKVSSIIWILAILGIFAVGNVLVQWAITP